MSYKIESQLNEDQTITDVSCYLGFIHPRKHILRFNFSPKNEISCTIPVSQIH